MPRKEQSMRFDEVIDQFLKSPQYTKLAEATQYNYRHALQLAGQGLGFLGTDEIRPKLVQEYLDGLSNYPGKQIIARGVLRTLEKWAIVRDLLPRPITLGTEVIGSDGGHEPWTDEQVATAITHARTDLAHVVLLAANTGQRGSDIVKMRWSDIETKDGRGGINVVQKKTGKRLWVPFTGELSSAIDTWERRPPFFLILAPDGRQFSRGRLSHDWATERDSNTQLISYLSGCVLHGLRGTAVVRLRRAGASELEIASMVGMSEPMVARYSRLANQNKMAMAAITRLDEVKIRKSNQSGTL